MSCEIFLPPLFLSRRSSFSPNHLTARHQLYHPNISPKSRFDTARTHLLSWPAMSTPAAHPLPTASSSEPKNQSRDGYHQGTSRPPIAPASATVVENAVTKTAMAMAATGAAPAGGNPALLGLWRLREGRRALDAATIDRSAGFLADWEFCHDRRVGGGAGVRGERVLVEMRGMSVMWTTRQCCATSYTCYGVFLSERCTYVAGDRLHHAVHIYLDIRSVVRRLNLASARVSLRCRLNGACSARFVD